MTNFLARRGIAFIKLVNSHLLVGRSFLTTADINNDNEVPKPPLLSKDDLTHLGKCNIEIIDNDAWQLSSALAQTWQGLGKSARTASPGINDIETEADADVHDVEDMRIRGRLFYKLEKDSKEFEEYHYEFRGKGSKKKKKKGNGMQHPKGDDNNAAPKPPPSVEKQFKFPQKLLEMNNFCNGKRIRTPTYNQLTGPYHEPFCLDIFISKGSVRACIVHRATSKVVAVAHSISKDIKFDLESTKDGKACVTVGRLLAQRALEDDIHNAIYTPRKGEKLEGKLLLVLQTVIDNGLNVKLKIKQRKPKKQGHKSPF